MLFFSPMINKKERRANLLKKGSMRLVFSLLSRLATRI